MIVHETKVRVRYGDTDKMGYVYYGTYPLYYELGRTELMRHIGYSYKQLEDSGIMLPVHLMEAEYFKPAFYDDMLTIRAFIKELPTARICFHYEIYVENNVLINKGKTELVFVESKTMKPVRPPKYFLEILKPYFNV